MSESWIERDPSILQSGLTINEGEPILQARDVIR